MSQHDAQDATQAPHDDEAPSRPLLQAAVLALLLLLLTAGVESYRDLAIARDREAELERRIEATRAGIERLEDHIRRIDEDPATLERLAREELGWVREGDVVIVLPEATAPAAEGGSD